MGEATADPHLETSLVKNTRKQVESHAFLPFSKLADKLDTIMVAHAIYPHITGSTPASLSQDICKDMRRQLRAFNGLLITDDLDMGAITQSPGEEECFQNALHAGNDLLLVCHEMESLTPGMIPGNFDISQILKPALSPVRFSQAQFTNVTKALNGLCG